MHLDPQRRDWDGLPGGDRNAQTFTVYAHAPSTPIITNIPSNAIQDGTYAANVSTNGDGSTYVVSDTTSICTVSYNVYVYFVNPGTCTLQGAVSPGLLFAQGTKEPGSRSPLRVRHVALAGGVRRRHLQLRTRRLLRLDRFAPPPAPCGRDHAHLG